VHATALPGSAINAVDGLDGVIVVDYGHLRMQVVERLLPSPGLRMQPGVEDEARAHPIGRSNEAISPRIAIHLQLLAERGCVQAHPSTNAGAPPNRRKPRKVDPLPLQLELIVMAGHGLTQILRGLTTRRAPPRAAVLT